MQSEICFVCFLFGKFPTRGRKAAYQKNQTNPKTEKKTCQWQLAKKSHQKKLTEFTADHVLMMYEVSLKKLLQGSMG